ncbi:hypothetical protein [Actinokineospora sp. NBRC 105648]|uniref:AMIN-like domain-containing (lipo)protein n=1 Tax=Actinokineospora sp. NBRC 105648 TaxID=3032206 RepID=UPI0024A4283F|nr:hypothetical protein [Actinokineospora sp. NBRC 105648]GLZ38570.1 hypothetical protein Acsp05_21940 [Actinokineospora sp. NBRC 105648]
MDYRRPLIAALLTTGLTVPIPAAAAEPYCGITWGSTDKSQWFVAAESTITGVRAGRHDCYDRLVVDLADAQEQDYDLRYQDSIYDFVTGAPIALRGGAYLMVLLDSGPNQFWDPAKRTELVDVGGYRTFRQVAYTGRYRSGLYLALGVRARLPYRVSTLRTPGRPTRLVIDVAHQW